MKSIDILNDLYRGSIHPCDRIIRDDTNFAATMEAFTEQEGWLRERISDDNKERLDEIISYHKTIVDTMSYENFRYGFRLGVMLMMETLYNESTVLL